MDRPPRAEVEEAMQYHHPEKTLAGLPGGQEIRDEMLASLFGTDARTYREIKAEFAARARRCAHELLQDPRFARRVDRLPFARGETMVGLGDSITSPGSRYCATYSPSAARRAGSSSPMLGSPATPRPGYWDVSSTS